MTRTVRIHQIDAFTLTRLTGNPAGVVLDADCLSEAEMQAIARELNNADTAFVLKADSADHDLRVRFFTPRAEAAFVGHATVATHFVLSAQPGAAARRRQRTRGGIADVEIQGEGESRRIAIRQSVPPLGREINDRERLAVLDSLALDTGFLDPRCPPRIAGASSTRLLIGVRSGEHLKQLKPDLARLTTLSGQLGAAGYFVFSLSPTLPDCQTESRMFCPALGIPEDPVSGNAHGMLGVYLSQLGLLPVTDGRLRFTGAQGHHLQRPGRVDIEVEFDGGAPAADGASSAASPAASSAAQTAASSAAPAAAPTAVWIIGQAAAVFETTLTL